MKFAIIALVLALALGAQSSVIPLTHTVVAGPAVVAAPGSVAIHAHHPAVWSHVPWIGHGHWLAGHPIAPVVVG